MLDKIKMANISSEVKTNKVFLSLIKETFNTIKANLKIRISLKLMA